MALKIIKKPDNVHPAGNPKAFIFEDYTYGDAGIANEYIIYFRDQATFVGKVWTFTWGIKSFIFNFVTTAAGNNEYAPGAGGLDTLLKAIEVATQLNNSILGDDYTIEALEGNIAGNFRGFRFLQKVKATGLNLSIAITPSSGTDVVTSNNQPGTAPAYVTNHKAYVSIFIQEDGVYNLKHTLSASGIVNHYTQKTLFEVSDIIPILSSYLFMTLPTIHDKPMSINSLVRNYKLTYWSEFDYGGGRNKTQTRHVINPIDPLQVLMIGTPKIQSKYSEDFSHAYLFTDTILSNINYTQDQLVHKDAPYWIAVYKTNDFSVSANMYDETGPVGTQPMYDITTAEGFLNNTIVYIPIHPKLLEPLNPNLIAIEWNSSSFSIRQKIDRRFYKKNRFFLYLNSRGGIDTFWNKGFVEEYLTTSEIKTDSSSDTDTEVEGEETTVLKTYNKYFKISTGFYPFATYKQLEEMFASSHVWKWEGEWPESSYYKMIFTPIEISSNKYLVKDDQQRLFAVNYEYKHRIEEKYFLTSALNMSRFNVFEEFSFDVISNGAISFNIDADLIQILINGNLVVNQLSNNYTGSISFFPEIFDHVVIRSMKFQNIDISSVAISTIKITKCYAPHIEQLNLSFPEIVTGALFQNMDQFRNFCTHLTLVGINDFTQAYDLARAWQLMIQETVNSLGNPVALTNMSVTGTYTPLSTNQYSAATRNYLIANIPSVTLA